MIQDSAEPQAATWWVPGQRRRVRGTYEIGADGGVEISMLGSVTGKGELQRVPVLWGNVSGTRVTCQDVWGLSLLGSGEHMRARYTATRAFEGEHLRDPMDEPFSAVSLDMSHLEAFRYLHVLDPANPHHPLEPAEKTTVEVAIPGVGAVTFYSFVADSGQRFPERITIEGKHRLSVRPLAPTTFPAIWRQLIMPMSGLLTLSANVGNRISEIHFSRSRPHHRGWDMGIGLRTHEIRRDDPIVFHSQMLVNFANWDVRRHLPTWFALWQTAPVAFTSFSHSLDTNSTSQKLLDAASACEALHAGLYPKASGPSPKQAARLQRILDPLSSNDRGWAKGLLEGGHSATLDTRLRALVSRLDSSLAEAMLGDIRAWSEHVREVRNAISHSDARAAEYYVNPRLVHQLSLTLQAVFTLTAMQRIGFSPDQASAHYRNNYSLAQGVGRYPSMMLNRPMRGDGWS